MDRIILAKNVQLDGGVGITRPNDNQMIVGASGSGKTFSVMLPTLCHIQQSSFIGTFPKREYISRAVSYFKKRGYRIYVWNLANPEQQDKIPDPLMYMSSEDDIQELARQIVNGNPDYRRAIKFDPYWKDASEALLTGLIYYVLMTEQKPSMKKVIELFYKLNIREYDKGISTTLDSQFEWLESKAPESVAVRKFRAFSQLPYGTAGCVRDDLEKAIQNMFPISIQSAMTETACIDFREFATERTAIFIITSPVKSVLYGFANLLFSIAIRQLMEFSEMQEDHRLPRNVRLFFDDFSAGFPIQDYEKSIATFRAAGISSMMLCQSLSQLDATYGPENSTVILDNCSSLVYLPGGMNKKTCVYISEMLNRPLDEVMFMEMGNVIVFQSGKQPVIAPRYDTLADALCQEFLKNGNGAKRVKEGG